MVPDVFGWWDVDGSWFVVVWDGGKVEKVELLDASLIIHFQLKPLIKPTTPI